MKKLMIVLAAVALAGATQAATFKWASLTGQYMYKAGTTTKASGTIYLFDSSVVSQSALLDALLAPTGAKTIDQLTSLDSTSLASNGSFSKTSDFASIGADQTLNAYVAIVDGENVFVSALKDGTGQASATTSMNFSGLSNASKAAASEWTLGGTSASAGWYKSVPEPTSGLLMLVGLGALALRRRRA